MDVVVVYFIQIECEEGELDSIWYFEYPSEF